MSPVFISGRRDFGGRGFRLTRHGGKFGIRLSDYEFIFIFHSETRIERCGMSTRAMRLAPARIRASNRPLDGSSARFEGESTRSNHAPKDNLAQDSLTSRIVNDIAWDVETPWTRGSFAALLSMKNSLLRLAHLCLQSLIATGITASSACVITWVSRILSLLALDKNVLFPVADCLIKERAAKEFELSHSLVPTQAT